jgi:hypothetical protein
LAYIILELIVWCGTLDSYKLCVINGISLWAWVWMSFKKSLMEYSMSCR